MRLVPFADLLPRFGIPFRRNTIRRLSSLKLFPQAVKIGRSRIAFFEHEILEYLAAKAAERNVGASS